MAQTFFRSFTRDDREAEVEVEIIVNSWGAPQSWDCPAEPMECEFSVATDESGARVDLTEKEMERAELEFYEDPPEVDYGPDDD